MGSGDSGSTTTSSGTSTVRYAPYIEAHHEQFLNDTAAFCAEAIDNSPYDDYEPISIEEGFFGMGYALENFPSLYDIYGKFVAGLDLEALWTQEMNSTVRGPEISTVISEQAIMLNDLVTDSELPEFQIGMRDINAVMTSSYVIGKALLYDSVVKQVNKFAADTKYHMIDIASDKWKAHLAWNQNVAINYGNMMKSYFGIKQGITAFNNDMAVRGVTWKLAVTDFERANLGALQGAVTTGSNNTSTTKSNSDSTSSWIGAAVAVAGMVAMFA